MKLTSKRKKAYILLIINVIIWGAALPIVKNSYEHTTPFRFLFYRYVIAAIASLPLLIIYFPKIKKKLQTISTILLIEFIGITINLSLLYIGLSKTTSIETGLITTAGPILSLIGGVIFLREKEERHELIGLAIAFLGTILLTLSPLASSEVNVEGFSLQGNILILMHTATNAGYFLLAKKYYKNCPKLFASGVSYYMGIVSFFVLALIEAGSLTILANSISSDLEQPSVILAGFYMGILGSIVALTCYIKGQDLIEASEASLFGYLQPLIYVPLAIFWLGEDMNILQAGSLVVVLVGVLLASRRH